MGENDLGQDRNRDLSGRKADQQEWHGKEKPDSLRRPQDDPFNAGWGQTQNLDRTARVRFGVIVETIPYSNAYGVMLEGDHAPITCLALTATGGCAVGSRYYGAIARGQPVWVIKHGIGMFEGVIIGVEPNFMTDARKARSDVISPGSNCGNPIDKVHTFWTQWKGNGYLGDHSGGRPFDSTGVGEQGFMSCTGLRLHNDPFMVQAAVDECTGLFVFYHDQLCRLAGYNLQIRSIGQEQEILDDQGEVFNFEGTTPYPWEMLGAIAPMTKTTKENGPESVQLGTPYYSRREPEKDDQMPYHRRRVFKGYLGQIKHERVDSPPPIPPIPPLYTYGREDTGTGLYEDDITLDGSRFIRTARRFFITKRPQIPVPKRLKRQENKDGGDNAENYRSSGLFTEADPPKHLVKPDIPNEEQSFPQLVTVASFLDLHAWVFNWQVAHPFHYHEMDWKLEQEEDIGTPGTNQEVIPFGALGSSQFLDNPDPKKVLIDHRIEEVDVYPNTSYFGLMEDGGVVLGDGFGAQIRMHAGAVFIDGPGDIWIRSGRNTNVWAGWDLAMRAQNSVDLSASARDVRIKAEREMQILAGNEEAEHGGILIESRQKETYDFSECGEKAESGGIMLKAKSAPVVAWAKDVYLRTGAKESGGVEAGNIVLDAGKGTQQIHTRAQFIKNYVNQSGHISNYFGLDDDIIASQRFRAASVEQSGRLCVDGDIVADGNCTIRNQYTTEQGTYIAPVGGDISEIEDIREVQEIIDECETTVAENVAEGAQEFPIDFDERWYQDGGAGSETVMKQAEFGFRTPKDYLTDSFSPFGVPEAHWQQHARLTPPGKPSTWKEKEVKCGDNKTYPYPGEPFYAMPIGLYEIDHRFYDDENGVSKERPTKPGRDWDYRIPTPYKTFKPTSLNDYAIVKSQD